MREITRWDEDGDQGMGLDDHGDYVLYDDYKDEIQRLTAENKMTDLSRKHIVSELFGYSAAHYDQGASDEQNAMAELLNRAANMLEEEGSAGEEIERLSAEVTRMRTALQEIARASGDDDDADSQHYMWIQDTAREALGLWCPSCKVRHDPDCEVHHHLMADGRCTCHNQPKSTASGSQCREDEKSIRPDRDRERTGNEKSSANSDDSKQECRYCSQEMGAAICGHEGIIRDVPMTCTRQPEHSGRHIACGAHHGIGCWPSDTADSREK